MAMVFSFDIHRVCQHRDAEPRDDADGTLSRLEPLGSSATRRWVIASVLASTVAGGCQALAGIDGRELAPDIASSTSTSTGQGGGGGAGGATTSTGQGAGGNGGSSTTTTTTSTGQGGEGGTPTPATCAALHAISPGLPSGVYAIDPGTPVDVYCDMVTDAGGWTLAAVCRPDDAKCYIESAVGTVDDPGMVVSAKLSDSVIRAILVAGERLTRGWWRQQYFSGTLAPRAAAVFNHLSDPADWSSAPCTAGDPLKLFAVKHAEDEGAAADMIALSAEAYALPFDGEIATLVTGCSCGANGWSNAEPDSCGLATWSAACEGAPSMNHLCNGLPAERADLLVWIR
jgi:hypothetical protein